MMPYVHALRSARYLFLLSPFMLAACSGDGGQRSAGLSGNDGGSSNQPDGGGGGGGGPQNVDGARFLEGVTVTTLAGSNTLGHADGSGAAASFDNPTGISVRADGMIFVTEYDGGAVRQITPDGTVTSLPTPPGFRGPYANVIASDGTLFVQTDFDPQATKHDTSGTIWFFGDPPAPVVQGLARPRGLGALPDGRIAIADRMLHTLKLFTPGSNQLADLAGRAGESGYVDGTGDQARFSDPHGIVAYEGDLLVADTLNHRIRRVALDGTVTTFAGDGVPGTFDGDRLASRFDLPYDLAVDPELNVYVSDQGNHRIRRIDKDGQVHTVAGDGTAGFADGPGPQARFFGQESIDISPDGKTLYVADGNMGEGGPYHRIRKIALP